MLRRKLSSARGETLTEILAAILVSSLAIMLMVSMVVTAMHINRQARVLDTGTDGSGGFYGALSQAETHVFTGVGEDKACPVSVWGDGLTTLTFSNVYRYTQEGAFGLTVYGEVDAP